MTLPCLSELRSHLQMILHLRWKSPVVLLRSESMHDVRLALAAGSDVDHRHDGRTALYDAFVNRRFDKMKLLLTAGCQPDVELGKCGETESCVVGCGEGDVTASQSGVTTLLMTRTNSATCAAKTIFGGADLITCQRAHSAKSA